MCSLMILSLRIWTMSFSSQWTSAVPRKTKQVHFSYTAFFAPSPFPHTLAGRVTMRTWTGRPWDDIWMAMVNVLAIDLQNARYGIEERTIVFMPHCDLQLYENLLRENWTRERLSNVVLIANRLSEYAERWVRKETENLFFFLPVLVPSCLDSYTCWAVHLLLGSCALSAAHWLTLFPPLPLLLFLITSGIRLLQLSIAETIHWIPLHRASR